MLDREVLIQEESDRHNISIIMHECDSAFPVSIVSRANFPEIYRKIYTNAIFLKVTRSYSGLEECLGYAAMYANDLVTKTAYISLICIKPEAQGLHIGSKLIQRCFEIAKLKGMTRIKLEVLNSNFRAIAFYSHHGFQLDSYTNYNTQYMMRTL